MKPKSLVILGIVLLGFGFTLRYFSENIATTELPAPPGKKYAQVNSETEGIVVFSSEKIAILGIGFILIGSFVAVDASRRESRK